MSSSIAFCFGSIPSRSQARWKRTFARATEARIFETFSSSCSMNGFGTRKRRWRSSPGHDAVAQEREHDLLRHVEPVRADLPALEVEEHLAARARGGRAIDSSYSSARLHQRVPLEVGERDAGAARAPLAGAARRARASCSARCAVESGCFVPVSRSASWRGSARKRRRAAANAFGVEAVERVVALGRADALPDASCVERPARAAEVAPARSTRAAPASMIRRAHAVHEDRELLHVLRAVREPLPRPVAGGAVAPPANATNGIPPTPPERRNSNASTESFTTAFSWTPLRSRSNGSPTRPGKASGE